MPLKLSALQSRRAETTLDVDGETLTIGYRPGVLTGHYLGQRTDVDAAILAEVADWDLLGEDGQPLPITPETVELLPIPFKAAVIRAVDEAVFPNVKRETS